MSQTRTNSTKPPTFGAPQCAHIKAGGEKCQLAAMRGQRFCHFHFNVLEKIGRSPEQPCAFPVLENAASVQLAVMNVIARLLNNQIETKTAGLILYGLQLASANMGRERELFPPPPQEEDEVEQSGESLAALLLRTLREEPAPSASEPPNFEAPIAAPLTNGE
jgi:hypothetical protein